MDVHYSKLTDFDAWMALAKEVGPLFGLIADEVAFQEALRQAISNNAAFCIRPAPNGKDETLTGGIVVSKESNEIAWFAVASRYRRMRYGRQLIKFAISKLNRRETLFLHTFDEPVSEGKAARRLYFEFGFTDYTNGGLNPAGVPTVIMQLAKSDSIGG